MTQIGSIGKINIGIDALTAATGAKVLRAGDNFVHLTAPGTFYFPFGNRDSTVMATEVQVDAIFAGTITIEGTCCSEGTADAPDTTDFDAAVGKWLLYNPTAAVVLLGAGIVFTAATGAAVVTAGAATAALWMLPDWGIPRGRVKVVMTSATGNVRVTRQGKY